jgi:hypothetical protein
MKINWLLPLLLIVAGCSSNQYAPSAEDILIDEVRTAHGSDKLDDIGLQFVLRNMIYTRVPSERGWNYSRLQIINDSTVIRDEWHGDQVERFINDERQTISTEQAHAYKNSINSVFYFALLPDALADEAVRVKILNEVEIFGTEYIKFQVTFTEDGGGEDFEDIYIYWVSKKEKTMDYFAYQYFTEGGGMRFREASNVQLIHGFRLQDYRNYKPLYDVPIFELDSLFEVGGMELVSEINLENIQFPFVLAD